jgi:teichuronic acid biosynthesis glycosyltransferase TuaG
MENPLVSIITPSYNSEKFISETIKSVQNQTYKNWEMIIVDDSSTDNTVSIIRDFLSDTRINLYQLSKNSGTGIARNEALSFANGRFIAFLDSDDLWKPRKLEKQINYLISEKKPFTFSFYDCIDENGDSLKKTVEAPKNLKYRQLFWSNLVGNLTGIYDTNYFGKIEISSFRKRQDWILWLTILKELKEAKPVPESLAIYRVRDNSLSASKTSLMKHNYNVYRYFHKLNPLSAMACMVWFLFTHFFVKTRYVKKNQ